MDEIEQEQLVAACIKGDPKAYEKLIHCFQTKIYSLAMRMLGDPDDAADVTQETFIRVFRTLNKYRGDATLATWIYRITANLCLDWLRQRKRKALSSDSPLSWGHETVKRQIEDNSPGPEEQVATAELRREIQAALNKLEDHHRLAIILRDVQGLSYDEIAEVLQCPLGTIKSRINRGRQQLKQLLEEDNII